MQPPALSAMLCFTCPECRAVTFNPKDIQFGYCGACHLCLTDTSSSAKPEAYPPMWVIYDHPADHPEHFVVRVQWGPWAEKRYTLAGTLELARMACLAEGAGYHMPRYAIDAPSILEVWL